MTGSGIIPGSAGTARDGTINIMLNTLREEQMNNQEETVEIDLLEILYLLGRRIWSILAVGLAAGLITGLLTHYGIEPKYSSTSKLYILSTSTSITSLADIQIGTSLTKDYVQLVQSRPVVEQVIENLNLNRTYEQVLGQVTFSNPSDTRILVITAQDPDPVLAKDIVDEFANVAKSNIAEIMKIEEPSVAELGYITNKPVSPNLLKNVLIGALLGMFIMAVIVIVIYMIDDTVKSSDDIEKYLGLNTLTSIPLLEDEGDAQKKSGLKLPFGGKKIKKLKKIASQKKASEQGKQSDQKK